MELVLPLKEKNADDLEGVSFLKLKEEIPSRELRYPYPYISPPWEKENHLQTYHPWGCVSSQEGKPKVWCQIQYIFPRLPTCEQLGWTEFDFSGSNSCFTKIGVLESSDIKRRDSIRNCASFSNYHQKVRKKKPRFRIEKFVTRPSCTSFTTGTIENSHSNISGLKCVTNEEHILNWGGFPLTNLGFDSLRGVAVIWGIWLHITLQVGFPEGKYYRKLNKSVLATIHPHWLHFFYSFLATIRM